MADKIVETEKITPPASPGVDHVNYVNKTRQDIATALGVSPDEVTPKEEVAEKNLNNFLQGVAHTEPETQPAVTEDGQSVFDDIREEIVAFTPGEEGETDRVIPTKEAFDLEAVRKEKMENQ